jgi:hypothetical protein
MGYASNIRDQLHMVHNPFADTTQQPKIPDGKVNSSLGFQTSTIQELSNATGEDTIEILLYAGTNSMYVAKNVAQATLGSRDYFIPNLTGSNAVNWGDVNNPPDPSSLVIQNEQYGLWRVVSCGLRLKLLNPSEEDDGWWEAIRMNKENECAQWRLTTTGNVGSRTANGTVAPVGQLTTAQETDELVNNPTYSTGLLRDLHRVQFELHGKSNYHDFIKRKREIELTSTDIDAADTSVNYEVTFNQGADNVYEMADNFVDTSYEMIYIRLHCRSNTGTAPNLGSRFHVHGISNQEIYFDENERENRFHTKTHTVGASHMSIHFQGRRELLNAATLIMPT